MTAVLATILLIIAVPVAAWWVIGDRSTAAPAQADYLVRSPELPAWAQNTLGITALVVIVVFSVVLYRSHRKGLVGSRQGTLLAFLVPAGIILAATGRLVTAGVVGANIGGGLSLLFGLPTAGILLLAAITIVTIMSFRKRRETRKSSSSTG